MAKGTFEINSGKGKQTIEFDSVEDIDNMIDILQTLKKQVNDVIAGQGKEEEPEGELHTFRIIGPTIDDGFKVRAKISAEYFRHWDKRYCFFINKNIVAIFPDYILVMREDCVCKDEEA